MAIVAAIVSLAAALRLDAVAVGVEEGPQALALRELHCPYAQGFLFGLPEPALRAG
jgi:EAL domain-containing protein (putative c-di-GMP-specific phosphodiesterase class I)